jgi:hypothetical protein
VTLSHPDAGALEAPVERFFADLHHTAGEVASMSGLSSKFVIQPIELMAVLHSREHVTFGSLVKRLPLPDEQIHVVLIVCSSLVEKPAVHVFPSDLIAPLAGVIWRFGVAFCQFE